MIPIALDHPGWRIAGLSLVFIWFAIGGIGHFVMLDAFASIIPPGLPWPEAAVLISGFFELLGAVGILLPRFRALAGWGLVALTICVTPANVYMWLHPELFPQVPEWLLFWRLPFQVFLLFCIVASTQKRLPGFTTESHGQ
ncbi:hypothetical protein [Salinicola acroporae]|uniref:DoxX family protein n=1 Tax=Salinicola acroporae TaxID=1541440 RepID=UPI001F0B77C4|nr:hypothetical protein [Salinicola acroporae]